MNMTTITRLIHATARAQQKFAGEIITMDEGDAASKLEAEAKVEALEAVLSALNHGDLTPLGIMAGEVDP
jgi:hypothetical protein